MMHAIQVLQQERRLLADRKLALTRSYSGVTAGDDVLRSELMEDTRRQLAEIDAALSALQGAPSAQRVAA